MSELKLLATESLWIHMKVAWLIKWAGPWEQELRLTLALTLPITSLLNLDRPFDLLWHSVSHCKWRAGLWLIKSTKMMKSCDFFSRSFFQNTHCFLNLCLGLLSVIFFFEFTNQVLSKISLLNVIQVKKEKKKFCKMIISMDWNCQILLNMWRSILLPSLQTHREKDCQEITYFQR